MSENLRLYHAALYAMNAVVQRVDPDRWDEPSKCAEWSCREVLGHSIWTMLSVAAAVDDGDRPEPLPEADMAGPDPLASWIAARDRVLEGLDREGSLHREANGPFGPMPVDFLLRISASDLSAHTWDIGAAIDVDPALDPAVAAAILPGLMAAGDALRAPGMMAPAVELDDDASVVDRFLAYSGRDPRA